MQHRSESPPLHLHSLQRSALEFEVPASIFADLPGKGSFGLDQEMSLLSHVELNAEAKQEERTVLGSSDLQQTAAVERPSLRSHRRLN